MDKKILKTTALIFVGLAMLAIYPWLNQVLNKPKNLTPKSVDFSGLTKNTVNKIVISKGSEEKVISFRDNHWFIGEEEADEEKIDKFFQGLAKLKIESMVSENENNQEKFKVTRDNPDYKLTLTQNEEEHVFLIGKTQAAMNEFYLRRDGIKNVYLVKGELQRILDWSIDEWKKKTDEDKKDS